MLDPIGTDDAEAYVAIAARLLDLPLDPDHLPGVVANMRTLLAHAAIVNGFVADFDLAPAPEFIA